MGTNYYVKTDMCAACGRGDETIHIGKSSMGWKFSFAYNDGIYYKSVPELKKWLKGKVIWNEYGEKITHKDFWELVQYKQKNYHPDTEAQDHYSLNIGGYRFVEGEYS